MPLEPHPTDPNLVVYRVQKYAIPRWDMQEVIEKALACLQTGSSLDVPKAIRILKMEDK